MFQLRTIVAAFSTLALVTPLVAYAAAVSSTTAPSVKISYKHPLIYYHGRWDSSPGTWWAGSGLKLNIKNLRSLSLELGPYTTAPYAALGVSVGYGEYFTLNVSAGINEIPLRGSSLKVDDSSDLESIGKSVVVRLNVEGWQNNRINLKNILVNPGAQLLPYKPAKLAFQFIGDSLSSGQFLPLGINQAWPFLIGEHFKAEHRVNAQPGATLTDMVSYGNVHGVSYQFFKTEDTGYIWTSDHNYTTPWDFSRDQPPATHVVIQIGANDASHGITGEAFVKVYTDFIAKLRGIYPHQPIFVFTPWGWPNADGNTYYYYDRQYQAIVDHRHALGDKNVFMVNTTGWVTWNDVYPDNVHPNPPGNANIAAKFIEWLKVWGLEA